MNFNNKSARDSLIEEYVDGDFCDNSFFSFLGNAAKSVTLLDRDISFNEAKRLIKKALLKKLLKEDV